MVEMMRSSHSNTMYDQNLRKSPSLAHTTPPDAELLAPAPSTIHRTLENRSAQTIQQLTAQQNPRERDVETIRQLIERFSLPPFAGYRESENLYNSDSDRDSILPRVTLLYILHRRIN